VNNLPWVALDSTLAGIRIRDLLIAIQPSSHTLLEWTKLMEVSKPETEAAAV